MNGKRPENLSYSDFLLIETQASGASSSQLPSTNDWSLPVKEVPKINHVTDFQEKDNSTTNTTKRAWNTVPQSTIIAATEQTKRKKSSERTNSPRKSADSSQSKSSAKSEQNVHQRTNIEKSTSTTEHRENVNKTRISVTQQKEPTFFIGGGNGAALIEKILLDIGWKRVTEKYNENFKLKWVEARSMVNYGSFREGEQLVNRIPNCSLLTNKLGLLNSLQRYDRVNATINLKGNVKMRSSDFMPETYRVDDPIDRKLFLETYQDGETWICKPAGMNQGRGIYLVREIEEFKKILDERDDKIKKSKRPGVERIVQRYEVEV
ncbi:hypothetical protein LSH36_114g02014 [Paralvinella palmiformis]|uniref:Uncharacterized protein n=1 Tax=Paralvinella palmiformis TaxID=53620 RepID=A0AAD9JYV3_9ANNE|nr:hypothetical protein LSH36_114g02014 [Paralvinella palmiformis]